MVTLTSKQLAEIIGKEIGPDDQIYWKYEDLQQVKIALRALRLTTTEDSFLIDGLMPYWLYLAILASLSPKTVLFNTHNHGAITIPENTPKGIGSGFTFTTSEEPQFTLVQFSSPSTWQTSDLASIVPPEVNPSKGVIISSAAPFWIIATVALAYAKTVSWVACTQKNGSAIIAISNNKSVALGTEFAKDIIAEAIQNAAKGAFPRRGEIWMFDDGYGLHPGLVISPSARNQHSEDVLVIPFTTSAAHARRHLAVAPQQSGLGTTNYAKYSNISRMGKEQLLKGPVSVVTDELLDQIVCHVRQAIGDTAA